MTFSSEIPDKEMQSFFNLTEQADLRSLVTAIREDEHSQLFLYSACHEIYRRTNTDDDLDKVINVAESILPSVSNEIGTYTQLATETSELLRAKFERSLSGEDLDRAIHWIGEANRKTPKDSEKFSRQMELLSILLNIKDNISPDEESEEYSLLEILPNLRIEMPGAVDIETNASLLRAKLEDPEISINERLTLASSLRNIFDRKFADTECAEYLGPAIEAAEMARDAASRIDVPQSIKASVQAEASYDLGMLLVERRRAQHQQDIEGLNYSIEHLEKAELIKDPKRQLTRMNSLSGLLWERYEILNHIDDIQRSVSMAKAALQFIPKHDVFTRPLYLYNYGSKLHALFEATRDAPLLDDSLRYVREALEALPGPVGTPRWTMYKTQVAATLLRKFSATGDTKYLNEGIECCDTVAKSTESASLSANYGEYWSILAGLLRARYERLEVREDIVGAVDAAAAAVRSLPPGHRYLAIRLCNLSQIYWRKFSRLRDPNDIDEAITNIKRALSVSSNDSIHRATILSTYSGLLTVRYTLTEEIADMDESISLAEQAWKQTPRNRIDHLVNRNNFARALYLRAVPEEIESHSEKLSSSTSLAYLNQAVDVQQSVVADTQQDNPDRAVRLRNLGNMLAARHKMTGLDSDLDAAADALDQCSQCAYGQPSLRISAASRAANLHLSRQRFTESNSLLRRAISLLRKVSPRALQQRDQQHMLRQFVGLATLATAVALDTGADAEDALCLLEDGRGIILGLLFEVRSDVAALHQRNPDLAARFERLRDELDAPTASQGSDSIAIEAPMLLTFREKLVEEFDEVVDSIRRYEEFRNFLKPPEVAEMRTAVGDKNTSTSAVVVVNVSRHRSDAFIVQANRRVQQLRLPELQLKRVQEWVALLKSRSIKALQMFELLEWLWNVLASPILSHLGIKPQTHSDSYTVEPRRIWWIPTGPLGSLPIHAAGIYHSDGGPSWLPTASLLDLVVSSYSPSIKALLFTRRNMVAEREEERNRGVPTTHRPLLIAMGRTPGCKTLQYAKREVEVVRKSLEVLTRRGDENERSGPGVTVLQEPDKAAVLAGMRGGATIVHFAGHGRSDAVDPLKSALLVKDWKVDLLTVKDLISLKLHENHPPILAYLSACSTGSNSVDDLLDESLHLMSACQLAGFQHVVGSLWAVSDRHCVDVAQAVFADIASAISNGTELTVALGLQEGVNKLRHQDAVGQRRSAGEDDDDEEEGSINSDGNGSENSQSDREEVSFIRTNRDGFSASSLTLGKSSIRGDPRIWAAYIHIGP